MDTVFARSTAPGRAGIAVIRLSGPQAWQAVRDLTRKDLPPPRRMARRLIRSGTEVIDDGVVVLFAEGASFTGEQSAELHLHGSEAVVRAVLTALGSRDGLRLADPGEFTRRALENDRIGLAEAEGLSALLEAESRAQHRQAIALFAGAFRGKADAWREQLTEVLALLEVTIDFADEDVPSQLRPDTGHRLAGLAAELRAEADGVSAARKIARGFEVALVGPVNSGKSTLLNRLSGREAAITSEIAGTTRDVIEVRTEIGGQLVTLLDTAGIRDTADPVERIGVERAVARAKSADLRLFLGRVAGVEEQPADIRIAAKADLMMPADGRLPVSAVTGEGVGALVGEIADRLSRQVSSAGLAQTTRQEEALRSAASALDTAVDMIGGGDEIEIVSEQLRLALKDLDTLLGRIGPEEVLGAIFSRFCIGK